MSGAAMNGAPVVEVDRVSKFFGGVVAVSDVTFRLRPGITAVLGPNGAGKSTLLRMVCGLTAPSKGTVRLLGSDPRSDMEVRRSVGLVPQQEQLYSRLTAREFVELACILHGVTNVQRRTRDALDVVEMDVADPRPLGTYSKGMRQRVKIAAAIVNEPAVLVADEPLSGLDPNQRAEVINLFHTLAGLGRSLVVSSHVLDEVEQFGSRVLVLAQGRLGRRGRLPRHPGSDGRPATSHSRRLRRPPPTGPTVAGRPRRVLGPADRRARRAGDQRHPGLPLGPGPNRSRPRHQVA